MPDLPGPLDGLRVLELAEGVAGPYCGKLLAALGADVVKVESPSGDMARAEPPFLGGEPHPERSGLFLYLNTNKRGVTLDLETEGGRALCRDLIARSDVVVEAFGPGGLAARGLACEELLREHPGLVLVSISDFGQDGPYAAYQSSDLVALALGGVLYICGTPGREPLRIGGQPAQFITGASAFSAALAALHYRDATGEGQQADVSMLDAIALAQEYPGATWSYKRELREAAPDQAPMFEVADGRVGLMYRQPNWPDFCELIGHPELIADPRFATNKARREHAAELNAIVGEWIGSQPKADVYHGMQSRRIPAGYICDASDLLESPQYRARGFFAEIDHPETGPLTYPGMPWRMGDHEWPARRAPLLGEDNDEVYGGLLGIAPSRLAELRAEGVV